MRFLSLVLFLFAELTFAANAPRWQFTFPYGNGSALTSIAVDAKGNTYLAGIVVGNLITATPGAYQSQNNGATGTCVAGGGLGSVPYLEPCPNAFVIKLGPGGEVIFATYFGGTAEDNVAAIAVDSQGGVYIAGQVVLPSPAPASAFPTTSGAAFLLSSVQQPGNCDACTEAGYLAKLNSSGTQLEYSTFIPGASVQAIAVDSTGDAFFTGVGTAGAFPTTPGSFQQASNTQPVVAGKLNPSGTALVWGTYLSGTQGDSDGVGIALDPSGNVLVGGTTSAPDFPATAGQFSTSFGSFNLFLAKLSSDASTLIYSTLLGPALPSAMKLAPSGDIYFLCQAAANFPVTDPGFGAPLTPMSPYSFLLHVSPDGSSILNSIYVPLYTGAGALNTSVAQLDADAAGNAYIVGVGSLPATPGAFQPAPAGDSTAQVAVAKISPSAQILGATYVPLFGGSVIAAERDGSVVVTGETAPPLTPTNEVEFAAGNFFPAITVENSASYVANTAAAGELVAIQGYGVGPAAGVTSAPSTDLAGVQVSFDSFAAPITYAQANQINAQVPWEIEGQSSTQVSIVYNGAQVGSVSVPVVAASPGIFYVTNADGSFNSPSIPAHAGELISIYGTGGGAMSPPGSTGGFWPIAPLSQLTQSVSVTIGGESLPVQYAGSAPTLSSGFFQINVVVPADLTSAGQFLCVTIDGVRSAPVTIAVQ